MDRQQFVNVDTGMRLAYVESGSPGDVPVILLHGVTDSWRSFEPVLPLLPTTIRAIALSQRGHGDSSRPAHGYRYRDFSEDLRAFLDALGAQSAVLAGHSMGSLVAQRFAVDYPDRVSALVLMGAFATLYRDAAMTEFRASQIAPLRDPIDLAFIRDWQLSTTATPIAPDLLEVVVSETAKVPARVWHGAFEGFLDTPDFSAGLERVSAPALLVWGDQDSYTGRQAQDRLMKVLPQATLAIYEGIGHALHWEQPARFARDLAGFVSQVNSAAA